MSAKPTASDLAPVFARLKRLLAESVAAHPGALVITNDAAGDYTVNSTKLHPTNKQPLCFGMVRTGKNYVSFHLMPVYGHAPLRDSIPPALKKRMQGKACFNFTAIDEPLFAELAELTARSCAAFKKIGYL